MSSVDIITLGEPLAEFAQRGNEYLFGFGGDTLNCAVAAARQGAKVGMITAVGADDFGQKYFDLCKKENIDTSNVLSNEFSFTGVYFISYDENGHHFSYVRKGSAASLITPKVLNEDYIKKAKILHVSGISVAISDTACETVFAAVAMAKKHKVKVSVDTNLRLRLWSLPRARAIINELMTYADIARPGLEDVESMLGFTDPKKIVDYYLENGSEVVALAMGGEGCLVATPTERQIIPVNPTKVVDASGAGDTFDGSLLSQVVAGKTYFEAADYANAAASLSVQKQGCIDSMPYYDDVIKLIKSVPNVHTRYKV